MKLTEFFKKSFFLLVVLSIFLIFLRLVNVLMGNAKEAWGGLLIAYVNFIAGVSLLNWGIEKSDKYFYSAFLGGMLARFVFMFFLLFSLIKWFDFDQTVLFFSVLIAYFSFLILEIGLVYRYSMSQGN
jgi:hypothetical protein